jgi:prevent-host-death family protein
MSGRRARPTRVGIRELRQNLSVYVRRVRENGQAYEVTERGDAVARLLPLEERESQVGRMMAEGRIAPAIRRLSDVPAALQAAGGESLAAILADLRAEESR